MRMTAIALGMSATLAAALPSCSNGGGGSGGGDPCSQYYDALVAYQQRCGAASSSEDPAQAVAIRSRFMTFCANITAAPGAGAVAQNLSACASKAATLSCSDSADCDTDTGGTQPDGAACTGGFQCSSGACDAENEQCGHCVAVTPNGQPCDASSRCAKDAVCNFDSGGTKGTCQPYIKGKAGESCQASGSNYVACDTNLSCVQSTDGKSATCQPRAGQGAACKSTGDCQRNLVCNKSVCDTGATAGADCGNGASCARSLVCTSTDHKCTAVTFVAGGQPCDDTHKCSRGRCKRTETTGPVTSNIGTCIDPLPDGAACQQAGTGDDGASCDKYAECISGKCQIPNPATCQ
jgi:hypothetical protein